MIFWPCKGSIIISSLTVIWYEWLGETWAVLELWMFLLNLVSELKFLNVFMGREDPIELNTWLYLCFLFCFCERAWVFCWGDGRNFLNSSFIYIYLYLSWSIYLMVRLNYLWDNSIISLESSYWRGGLWPRCWIKVNFQCKSWKCYWVCSTFKFLNDLSSDHVSQVGFYL